MIEFTVQGEKEFATKMSAFRARLEREIIAAINTTNTQLATHIKDDKLSGQVLNQRSGNLKRSIVQIPAEKSGTTISGGVGLSKNAPYGLAHEFGADIPERVPVSAQALHWIGSDGSDVFAKRARAFHLPERSFMRSSFGEFRQRFEESIREGVARAGAE